MAFQSIRNINPNTTQRPRSGFDPSGFSNIGRDPSVPPQLKRNSGISALPSGPDIRMKSKPSAPSYNFNRGQVGGMRDIPSSSKQPYYTNVEATRQKYFDNRPDISRDRLIRRSEQDRLYENFKNTQMKPVIGASNLYQSVTPGGPTLADEANRLANIYGPTPGEIMGDVKYGFGQIGKGIAEKGTPLMQLLNDIYGGVQNFFTPKQSTGTMAQDPLAGLTQGQISSYNQLIALGMDPQVALAQVQQRYAQGGIISL